MVKSIVSFENLSDYRLSLKGKGDFRKVQCENDDLLMETYGTSHGFRKEETKNGDEKYTLAIIVPESTSEYLNKVAEMLGDVNYSPVYETRDGEYLVYARVKMNRGGLVLSYIHDKDREKVHPKDLTGAYMGVRAILYVESIRMGEKPKLQLTVLQLEIEEKEMEFEDFFGEA